MTPEQAVRVAIALGLGLAAALVFDRLCAARGLLPPGFRVPWRRWLALAVLAGLLAVGVFAPVASLGVGAEPDFSKIRTPQLFALHMLMLITMAAWFLLGFAGREAWPRALPEAAEPASSPPGGAEILDPEGMPAEPLGPPPLPPAPPRPSLGRQLLAQFGLLAPNVPREIGVGLVLGLAAWVAVLMVLIGIGVVLWALGGENAVPKQPPALVPFIAGLPIGIRVLISLSAGVFEEGFFRGFLQPRIGIGLSTAFFALAHLSYGQPFMLIGITLLSLIYAFLVRWRQNLWPAIAAHALFDGVQLLVVVPAALRFIQGGKAAAALLLP
ncbi:MAG TPA: CPBP family intramembrane glutamic endopeptidase [Thermoanaerobaculia bacterium]|jgi:membrane protease YdiL (CAAX protease family)|nr:CPBP family intramembrane glutamic endopeptidase [Thermoanaerobaculia bacterium]